MGCDAGLFREFRAGCEIVPHTYFLMRNNLFINIPFSNINTNTARSAVTPMTAETLNIISSERVAEADAQVAQTGVLEMFAEWRNEDNSTSSRPALVSDRAILIGLILLSADNSPLQVRAISDLFQYRLSSESRELLDLPVANITDSRLAQAQWRSRTGAAFKRMLALMDPFPQVPGRALTATQIAEILDAHDTARQKKMKTRLDEFTAAFLLMTFRQQPERLQHATRRIDIALDQSFIASPRSRGVYRKSLSKKVADDAILEPSQRPARPVDVFAGWYRGYVNDSAAMSGGQSTGCLSASSPNGVALSWGWVANTSVRVDSEHPGNGRFPMLVISATVSMPNEGVSEEAVSLMRSALKTGLPAGVVDLDSAYSAGPSTARFFRPTFDLGFTPSGGFQPSRLGVQGGQRGAEFIEGSIYCPCMPQHLKDASKDFRDGTLDEATLRARIQEREGYQLRRKSKPNKSGGTRMICPAASGHTAATAKALAEREPGHQAFETVVGELDTGTVTVSQENIMRYRRAFPYKSAEWEAFTGHARNSAESTAGGSHRTEFPQRIKGLAAAQLFTTIRLTRDNLTAITRYLKNEKARQS